LERQSDPGEHPQAWKPGLTSISQSFDTSHSTGQAETSIRQRVDELAGSGGEDSVRDVIGAASETFAFSSEPVFFERRATSVDFTLWFGCPDDDQIRDDAFDERSNEA
jgi:hypothetical protein